MEKTQLLPLVLDVLRREPATQFNSVENEVRNLLPNRQFDDYLKLRDIFWELLIQGILAPGFNESNLELPFIHVTDYGMKCIEANSILPHDPDGYLERLKRLIGQPLDDIVLSYVREGLLTFLGGHYFSATVMLGVASEQCIDLLIEAYTNAIADTNRKISFAKKIEQAGRNVKNRFDKLRNELLALKVPPTLMDALDIQLSGIFTLIRYSRNDAGHPTGQVVDRDMAHGNLLLFPQYCKRVYDLIEYFRTHAV
jgi:hypothetical protein